MDAKLECFCSRREDCQGLCQRSQRNEQEGLSTLVCNR